MNIGSDFDPLQMETFTSAHNEFAQLRSSCPVAHSTAFNGFWALLTYQDVVGVLDNATNFITSVQNVVPKVAFTGRRPPLHLDPPEHTPYRQTINRFFVPKKIKELEGEIRTITVNLLAPLLEKGGGEFCSEFTQKYPGYVFSRFFHVSEETAFRIKNVTTQYNIALQNADDELVKVTSIALYEIAKSIIEARKNNPLPTSEDLTTALLKTKYKGKYLPEDMVLGCVRQLIVVGMIAPSVFLGCMLVHLAEHKDLQQLLRNKPHLSKKAVEEYLRLFTPYRGFARTSQTDIEINGRFIKKGEPIALVYASANRDETVFPNPDEFILNRPNISQHIAFGRGPHYCAGAPLARLMLRVVLEELLNRTKDLAINGTVKMTRWPEWGTLSVPFKATI
ncbi:MAG: cytochrome P450 [Spirosomataceae bacterium]